VHVARARSHVDTTSSPAGVFEAFVADISVANAACSEADARAVFARHSFELL
jgi:hypothetical protein